MQAWYRFRWKIQKKKHTRWIPRALLVSLFHRWHIDSQAHGQLLFIYTSAATLGKMSRRTLPSSLGLKSVGDRGRRKSNGCAAAVTTDSARVTGARIAGVSSIFLKEKIPHPRETEGRDQLRAFFFPSLAYVHPSMDSFFFPCYFAKRIDGPPLHCMHTWRSANRVRKCSQLIYDAYMHVYSKKKRSNLTRQYLRHVQQLTRIWI
jgi:hypothetical protein